MQAAEAFASRVSIHGGSASIQRLAITELPARRHVMIPMLVMAGRWVYSESHPMNSAHYSVFFTVSAVFISSFGVRISVENASPVWRGQHHVWAP